VGRLSRLGILRLDLSDASAAALPADADEAALARYIQIIFSGLCRGGRRREFSGAERGRGASLGQLAEPGRLTRHRNHRFPHCSAIRRKQEQSAAISG
jgi:hypothetical protein